MKRQQQHHLGISAIVALTISMACDDGREPNHANGVQSESAEGEGPDLDLTAARSAGSKPAVSAQPSKGQPPAPASAPEPSLAPPSRPAAGPQPSPASVQPSPAVVASQTTAPEALAIVRRVVAKDIDVPMTSFEEVTGTPCPMYSNHAYGHQDHYFRIDGVFLFRTKGAVYDCEGTSRKLGTVKGHTQPLWVSDTDGNIYTSWSRSDPATDAFEIIVAKVDETGTTLWEQALSTGKTTANPTFIRASPAGVFVGGDASGQLPGNPPEASRNPWVLRFDHAGTFAWLRQEKNDATSWERAQRKVRGHLPSPSVAMDGSDSLYLRYVAGGGYSGIQKLDHRGERVWAAEHETNRCSGDLQVAANGSAIFYGGNSFTNDGRMGGCVTKLDDKGELVWTNTYTPHHSKVINETEGTTWTGQSADAAIMALGKDSITLVGTYQNQYQHGSTPPPSFQSTWIATVGFDGQLISSRSVRIGPLDFDPGETGSRASFTPFRAAKLPNGDLRIMGNKREGRGTTVMSVTLPAEGSQASSSAVAASTPSPGPTPSTGGSLSSLWNRFK